MKDLMDDQPDEKRIFVHDMRNRLGAMIGGLAIIADREQDPTLKKLAANSLKMAQEINDGINKTGFSVSARQVTQENKQNWDHPAVSEGARNHDLFFAAIEMTRMPMLVTDPSQEDNPIIFVNNAFLQSAGFSKEEILGRNCRFLQGPDTDPETVAAIRHAIQNRTNVAVEIKNYRKDGTMFWNALFISPIFDNNGKLLYFFGSQLDVTRRRDAEAALRKAQKMEAIGQLTGGIAHDFNNLLQVMIGNLQMALQFLDDRSRVQRHINIVSGAADRARNLTQQLLAFSRKQALDMRVANINRVIDGLTDILNNTISGNIHIDFDLDQELWNTQIDTIQLEMSLINICANSRDAMGENGGTIRIETSNRVIDAQETSEYDDLAPGYYACIKISDDGSGMSPDTLSHVTEPFFTTKDVGKGTGLGLAQVYGFVKQSHGYMKIESEVGQGTTTTLLFPATRLLTNVTATPEEEGEATKGESILIVEDNQEVLDLAHEILRHKGYNVATATSPREALSLLEGGLEIDLLFTDIVMPGGINGITLANEVKKILPRVSILLTTGFAEDIHGQPRQSEYEIIYKPYMPNELVRKVHGVLNRRFGHRA